MKTLQRLIVLLAILFIKYVSYSQTSDLAIISKKYNSILKEQNKGIAVLVKKNHKTETISLGNFNLTENSVFNIGSATKTFTAILILQEIEKGTLKLTDSIGSYLTPIKNVDGSLTIRALLTHESGLDEVIGKNVLDIFYGKDDALYNSNLLDQVEENNPEIVGSFDYCNTNYFLLGKIIEKVTDQSYFDVLRERIILPLKMKNTYPYVHKNLPNLATPYHEGKDVTQYLDYRYFANIAYAAGSIASTLTDMEVFYSSLFETEKLLKKETVKMMMETGNEYYGLGLLKSNDNGTKYYGHGGNNIGYAFRNQYNPITKDMYLVFTNSKSIPSKKSITNDLLAYINNNPIENFQNIDIDNFKKYAGTYLLKEANLTLKIVLENDKMYLVSEEQGVKSELTQKNQKSLYDTTVGVVLTQIEGDNNSLSFNQNGFTTTINKVTTNK
ncbi:serine hydrolase domain-containing protein [Aquimarina litoralis]|uniref:serine hydrolase domain-containing protein n=1 Tax=Aquimarina litoralis TaxID=584605 RepID=UPI001C59DF42|nr:serine hydrolase domain-containing protein [Aquimarina litoralis]MBW1296469.1 serine hydrolase [Aquimarina litoralis]